jgi:hypothetical protein
VRMPTSAKLVDAPPNQPRRNAPRPLSCVPDRDRAFLTSADGNGGGPAPELFDGSRKLCASPTQPTQGSTQSRRAQPGRRAGKVEPVGPARPPYPVRSSCTRSRKKGDRAASRNSASLDNRAHGRCLTAHSGHAVRRDAEAAKTLRSLAAPRREASPHVDISSVPAARTPSQPTTSASGSRGPSIARSTPADFQIVSVTPGRRDGRPSPRSPTRSTT